MTGAPNFIDLPWLAWGQRVARSMENLRLPDNSVGPAPVLRASHRLVSNVEQNVARADFLLKRSRNEMLTAADWKDLADLISSARQDLWTFENLWDDRLAGLPERHVLNRVDAETVGTLRQRLDDARCYLYSDDMPWERTIRRIETRLPWGQTETVVADSRIVPGSALGASFAQGYPGAPIANPESLAQHLHAPGLEQTVLTNAEGQTLYSGLRHHFFRVDDLQSIPLSSLSDDELEALIAELYVPGDYRVASVDKVQQTQIETLCRATRAAPEETAYNKQFLLDASRFKMAREAALAALVADPQKLRRALDGEPVELDLFTVSLERSQDYFTGCEQRFAFKRWDRSVVKFQVRGSFGEPRTVSARICARTFRLMATDTVDLFRGRSEAEFCKLFGSAATLAAEGPVKTRIDTLRARARRLRAEVAALGPGCLVSVQQRGVDQPQALPIVNRVSRLGNEIQYLERNARTLQESAQQLLALQAASEVGPLDAGTLRRAAALLALTANLMGGTPILSCARDTNFTAELGAEISFLATVADRRNGHLPPIVRNQENIGENWEPALSQFRPH